MPLWTVFRKEPFQRNRPRWRPEPPATAKKEPQNRPKSLNSAACSIRKAPRRASSQPVGGGAAPVSVSHAPDSRGNVGWEAERIRYEAELPCGRRGAESTAPAPPRRCLLWRPRKNRKGVRRSLFERHGRSGFARFQRHFHRSEES